ncbi:MAG: hypothetical protein NUV31_10905, partial [Dehalococcoidales bacterium]|nr:hypothetical protein [Dehalococcoidales bacterium]
RIGAVKEGLMGIVLLVAGLTVGGDEVEVSEIMFKPGRAQLTKNISIMERMIAANKDIFTFITDLDSCLNLLLL